MKLIRRCTLLLLALPIFPAGAAGEKISIAELLAPETRMQTFWRFERSRNPKLFELYGWDDLAKFTEAHADLRVFTHRDPASGRITFAVAHQNSSGSWDVIGDAYRRTNDDQIFPPPGPPFSRYPVKSLVLRLFDEDGAKTPSVVGDQDISEGLIEDLTGDGQVEVLEGSSVEPDSGDPFRAEGGPYALLTVRHLTASNPYFALAYRTGPAKGGTGSWSYVVARREGEKAYDLLLGPKVLDEVKPEITLPWDRETKQWKAPRGDLRVRVLDPVHFAGQLAKLNSTAPAPRPEAKRQGSYVSIAELPPGSSGDTEELEKLPPNQLSQPYQAKSLATLPHSELLAYMGAGRTMWDVVEKRRRKGLPPDFFEREPKQAALAFVKQNRPPETLATFRLAVDDTDRKAAPDEGTLSYSDGPSGCFSPGGADEYFLRCSRESSYLAVIRRHVGGFGVDPLESTVSCDVRHVTLSYDLARHVLQVAWWMNRVRSKQLGGDAGPGGMGSTSDGFASFRLHTATEEIAFRGWRFDDFGGRFVVVGEMDATYTKTACLNAVRLLMARDLPQHLGSEWNEQDVYSAQPLYAVPSFPREYSAREAERLKGRLTELLRLSVRGGLGPEATREVVRLSQDLSLTGLGKRIGEISATLPARGAKEERLATIEAEIARWRKRLGRDGTDFSASYMRRENARKTAEAARPQPVPGLDDDVAEENASPDIPKDPKFGELDDLYVEEEKIQAEQSLAERALTELRAAITEALRWFETYDDPEQLSQLALSEPTLVFPVSRRLRELDPARAIAMLDQLAGQEKNLSYAQPLLRARDTIRGDLPAVPGEPLPDPLTQRVLRLTLLSRDATSAAQAEALMSIVNNKERSWEDRFAALELLAPDENPRRFADPAVDQFLIATAEAAARAGDTMLSTACRALALRGGGKHWDLIERLARGSRKSGMSSLQDLLPSLTFIAVREPVRFRSRLRALIAPQLTRTSGFLDQTIWAAWLTDQRQLKAPLEKLATSSAADVEGTLGGAATNRVTSVVHRFHSARKVVTLWNERDAATRAKLLIALGISPPALFESCQGMERLHAELASVAAKLDGDARAAVQSFLTFVETTSTSPRADPQARLWLEKAREIFRD